MYNISYLKLGNMENIIYFIQDEASANIAVIDPAWDYQKILHHAEKMQGQITKILLTHGHDDHTNAALELIEELTIHAFIHQDDLDMLPVKLQNKVSFLSADIALGESTIAFHHTPGHTLGSSCFHIGNHLFTGDSLFIYGCGHCRYHNASATKLFQSLQKITNLFPLDTLIMPGHHYADKMTTSLEEQLLGNPFLHKKTEQDFISYRETVQRSTPYQAEYK